MMDGYVRVDGGPAVETAGNERHEVRLRGLRTESAQADFVPSVVRGFNRRAMAGLTLLVSLLAGCASRSDNRAAPPSAAATPADPWNLTATAVGDDYRGTYLGNGTIGQRLMQQGTGWWHGVPGERVGASSSPLPDPRDARSQFEPGPLPAYMAGFYEQERLVAIPSPTAVDLVVGERRFMADPRHVRNLRQTLSMRDGVLRTEGDWDTGRGVLAVRIATLIARHDPNLAMVHLHLSADRPITVRLEHSLALPAGAAAAYDSRRAVREGPGTELSLTTPHAKVHLAQVERVVVGSETPAPELGPKGESAYREIAVSGETTVTRFVGTAAVAMHPDTGRAGRSQSSLDRARHSVESAVAVGPEGVFERHRAAWAKLWESDIQIEGPPEEQQAVRSFLFSMLQSAHGSGETLMPPSIPPMGLSVDAFGGHIFWDAETWIFPALLAFQPEMARSILDYRYVTLPAARANARDAGYSGASYAWESAGSGSEEAPEPFRHGRHVSADVALAVWQYWTATGDRKWLLERGWPILQSTAEYWVSRVRPMSDGQYGITRVTTPDENAGLVDNSAWVNFVARRNLEFATEAARILGRPADPRWVQVAKGLILPRDPETGLIREHDAYRGTKIKQADTLLLLFPGGLALPKEEQERLYDYYAPRAIEVGPAMTDSIHAIVAAKLGRAEEAYQRFGESYRPFLRPPFLMFSEKRSRDNLYFLTGAAGTLQAVLYGFGGLTLGDPDQPTTAPLLPPAWKSLTLKNVAWRGKRYDRVVRHGEPPTWTEVTASR
jgi:trehalose/maltose hydrolase-like predicted phosphorylase